MQTVMNVYGTFFKLDLADSIKTQISIQLLPSDLGEYWARCGLTADFGASFMSFCYPNHPGAKNSLSFILNELVENAIKFSNLNDKPITISLLNFNDKIIFEVSNFVSPAAGERFRDFITQYLLQQNIKEIYLDFMSKQGEKDTSSWLGLLTILNNFKAGIGFLFIRTEDNKNLKVTVQITINPLEI